MAVVTKKLDSKGRLVLGPEFANVTVLVEQIKKGEFLVQTAAVVPANEVWLFKNKEASGLLQTGLEQAKSGKVVKGPLQKNKSWIDKLED